MTETVTGAAPARRPGRRLIDLAIEYNFILIFLVVVASVMLALSELGLLSRREIAAKRPGRAEGLA